MLLALPPAGAAPSTHASSQAQQASPPATRIAGWSTKAAAVRLGGELSTTVTVAPAAKRTIRVEYRKRGTTRWLSKSSTTTSSAGSAYVRFQPPRAGAWQVRLSVAATRSASKLVTKSRTVTARGTASVTTLQSWAIPSWSETRKPFAVVGAIKPAAARRVEVQIRGSREADTGFNTVAVVKTSSDGRLRTTAKVPQDGAWKVRIVVNGTPSAKAVTGSWRWISASPALKFGTAGAAGLALAPTGSSVAIASTNSLRTARAVTTTTEPTLVAVESDGSLTDAVISGGDADVSRFLIAPNGDVYLLFANPTNVAAGGRGQCLLARVDRDSGVPLCVDKTLMWINWAQNNGNLLNPAVQFDDTGAVYYAGQTHDGHTVLRKYTNGISTDLINDAISVQAFLVLGDGSVFLRGSTTVTGSSWLRRITPQGALQTLANSSSGNLLHKFPDGNVYIGLYDGTNYGVRRFLASTGQMDPKFWIASNGTPSGSYLDVSPFCAGPTPVGGSFCSYYGASVAGITTTDEDAVYGRADGVVMQYFPTLTKPATSIANVTAVTAGSGTALVLAGLTAGGANILTTIDTATDIEMELIGAANEVETYRLHYLRSTNSIMFDGLRFADNKYVVGQIDLDTMQATTAPTGSSRLIDFQTF